MTRDLLGQVRFLHLSGALIGDLAHLNDYWTGQFDLPRRGRAVISREVIDAIRRLPSAGLAIGPSRVPLVHAPELRDLGPDRHLALLRAVRGGYARVLSKGLDHDGPFRIVATKEGKDALARSRARTRSKTKAGGRATGPGRRPSVK